LQLRTVLIVGLASFAVTAPAVAAHADAIYTYGGWTVKNGLYVTCSPGAKIYDGRGSAHPGYMVFNNAWLEKRQCVGSDGYWIGVRSPVVGSCASIVRAYPSVRYGAFGIDRDKISGFPRQIDRLGEGPYVHVSARGDARGCWQADVDAWIHPTLASWSKHGTAELVVVYRKDRHSLCRGCVRVKIQDVTYLTRHWMTVQRNANGSTDRRVKPWLILYFRRLHGTESTVIPAGALLHYAVRHHWIPRTWWLGDVANGAEIWCGGAGLRMSMVARGRAA
jgi:hypothetical protein